MNIKDAYVFELMHMFLYACMIFIIAVAHYARTVHGLPFKSTKKRLQNVTRGGVDPLAGYIIFGASE